MHTECTKMGKTIDTAENCKTCRQAATTDSSDTQQNASEMEKRSLGCTINNTAN
jgi:hypothetical protein